MTSYLVTQLLRQSVAYNEQALTGDHFFALEYCYKIDFLLIFLSSILQVFLITLSTFSKLRIVALFYD